MAEMSAQVINLSAAGGGMNADKLRPVGSIYQSMADTDPGLLFGGVWERYGQGRVAVGQDDADADFAVVGAVGGEKAHTLSEAEMPAHGHVFTLTSLSLSNAAAHTHSIRVGSAQSDNYSQPVWSGSGSKTYLQTAGAHAHMLPISGIVSKTGEGFPHNNLMPYTCVFTWKRVA